MRYTSPLLPRLPTGEDLAPFIAALREAPPEGLTLRVGEQDILLPAMATSALLAVAEHLQAGRPVYILDGSRALTTEQAAELLSISRPTLPRRLEEGALPYAMTGAHRRILLADVLSYRERMTPQRGPRSL